MELINQAINQIKNFGTIEWILIALVVILLATVILYNKGVLKCQEKLADYENELKDAQTDLSKATFENDVLNDKITQLIKGEINND